MGESVLLGPFLTRREAASLVGVAPMSLVTRQDVLRIGGSSLEEAYFGFQFDSNGLRANLGCVVTELAATWDHLTIAHWLSRSNAKLEGLTPLAWLDLGRDANRVLDAAASFLAIPEKAAEVLPMRRAG